MKLTFTGLKAIAAPGLLEVIPYVPAGAIPVLTGYLIDFWGVSIGISSLALSIACLASLALMQLWRRISNQSQARAGGGA